jgi:hypothetical protein
MTKVFLFGAPGSGLLRVAEELYARTDFKKSFSMDPMYKRSDFPKDVQWADLNSAIKTNYTEGQDEPYELHGSWWISKFYRNIIQEYPESIFIFVSRNDDETLKRIGINGSSMSIINLVGGEDAWGNTILKINDYIHEFVYANNAEWVHVAGDGAVISEDFEVLGKTGDPRPATVKIAIKKP